MKKIFYAKASYGQDEINAVLKVLKNPLTLMDGKNVKNFEKQIAKIFGKKYALMVNSGSSANLLALQCLNLKKNSEVITPLLTFSTTVAPIYQLGLYPYFVDVEEDTFNISIQSLNEAILDVTKENIYKMKAIIAVDLYGLPANYNALKDIA